MPDIPPRIVIVDDDQSLAQMVERIAREAYPDADALEVETAFSAEEALQAIERAREAGAPAVFLSDFHLPPSETTGVDILAEVQLAIPQAKRVLMTGRDREEIEPLIEDADLDAFVPKPFTFHDMRGLIERLVAEVAATPSEHAQAA